MRIQQHRIFRYMTTQSTSVLDQVRMPNGQVFIRAGKEIDEWVYLELQGELQSTSASINLQRTQEPGSASYLLGMPLGDFQFEPQVRSISYIVNPLLQCWPFGVLVCWYNRTFESD